MIVDMEANKRLSPIVTEWFLKGRKINISLVFLSQSYFKVPKTIRLNATHFLSWKYLTKENSNKLNHSSDIEFKNFMKYYKDYTKEPFSFWVNDTTLPSHNPLRFRKNML